MSKPLTALAITVSVVIAIGLACDLPPDRSRVSRVQPPPPPKPKEHGIAMSDPTPPMNGFARELANRAAEQAVRQRVDQMRGDLRALATALEQYHSEHQRYPTFSPNPASP